MTASPLLLPFWEHGAVILKLSKAQSARHLAKNMRMASNSQTGPKPKLPPILDEIILSTGPVDKGGYAQLRLWTNDQLRCIKQGHSPRYAQPIVAYLHHMAWIAYNKRDYPTGTDTSHLCDRRNCFSATHLTAEKRLRESWYHRGALWLSARWHVLLE